ncbi:peptide chain release factor N(5)-glutamine methyltransferase [Candidatus Dependentiae bacterium]|nr:peptide chain release factor N(5)-glutamine methyltransferase [Candidatus Dependentiae bacterium]
MQRIIQDLAAQLLPVCDSEAEATSQAWQLLEHVLGKQKKQLLLQNPVTLSPGQTAQLTDLVLQRVIARRPLQYLLGIVPFKELMIKVSPPTLIPRPETEEWVSWLIEKLQPVSKEPLRILDLCTGSGCIALALAKAFPRAEVWGIDIAEQAIALAQENALHNHITNVRFVCADLWEGVPFGLQFDLIVANPPYITPAEYEQLQPEVLLWEDVRALKAEQQGLAVYARIAQEAWSRLYKNSILANNSLPVLVMELGTDPAGVQELFAHMGFSKLVLQKDLQQVYRWLAGRI